MTPERKAEVNLRLTTFDLGPAHAECDPACHAPINFCADLNALARLETKLPPLQWEIGKAGSGVILTLHVGMEGWSVMVNEWTESEARAEAICQYLESSHAAQS